MSDVVDLEAEPEPSTIQGEPSSPEVQFMGATRRPQPAQPRPPSVEQAYGTLRSLFGPRLGFADVFAQFTDEERFRQIMEQSSRSMIELWIGGARARRGEDVDLAIDLDNGDPFDLNYTETSRREPEYVPPPAAPEGFTRTPKAGDVAVCPNCDNELGAGEEPLGRQIWVSKQCGHVSILVCLYRSDYANGLRAGLLRSMCKESCTVQEQKTGASPQPQRPQAIFKVRR